MNEGDVLNGWATGRSDGPMWAAATAPDARLRRMTATAERVDGFEERRRELADAALETLIERGYARTSLREIAQTADVPRSVLHGCFRDKMSLITYCVRRYKLLCVGRFDELVVTARTADGLALGFADAMAATLVADAALHRLWYDVRAQALFEGTLRADVDEIDTALADMIWRMVSRYAELAAIPPTTDVHLTYAIYDGLFQQALARQLSGEASAPGDLRTGVRALLRLVCCPDPGGTRAP